MDESDQPGPQARITSRLIDSLYTEAMLLADEARSYFDDAGRDDRATLEPFARVGFACESLKVTTRIMHIVAWLLTQRAIEVGEIPNRDGRRPERRLGHAQDSDKAVVAQLPEVGAAADQSSADLYARVKRLDEGTVETEVPQSPARALMGRLERGLSGGGSALARAEPRFGGGILLGEQVDELGRRGGPGRRSDPLAGAPDVAPRLAFAEPSEPNFIAVGSMPGEIVRDRARRSRSRSADNCRERR